MIDLSIHWEMAYLKFNEMERKKKIHTYVRMNNEITMELSFISVLSKNSLSGIIYIQLATATTTI